MTDAEKNKRRKEADTRLIRCRRLGHEISFLYCRTQEGKSICRRIRDCWWERLDIDSYLRDIAGPDELAELQQGQPPPDRLSTIIKIAHRVKNKQD